MIKKILITGANGFIGSHLVDLLVMQKYEIHVLVRKTSDLSRLSEHKKNIKYHYLEVGLLEIFRAVNPDIVIHLATKYIKAHSSITEVDEMLDSNIKFPTQLCETMLAAGVKYFINTGTCFEYKLDSKPLTEDSEIEPYNFYAATKIAFNDIIKYYSSRNMLTVIDLKLFFPYGEKDNEKVITFLINSLIQGKEIEMSEGEQQLNFTYVKDICVAYLSAIKQISSLSGYNSFNVGTNKVYSIKEIVTELEKISNKKLKVKWGVKPYPTNEIFYMNCNPQKIKNILKWSPMNSLRQGLENAYIYYQSKLNYE